MFLFEDAIKELNALEDFIITDIILFDDVSNIDLRSEEDLDGAYPALIEDTVNKYVLLELEARTIIDKLKKCSIIHSNDYYKVNNFLKKTNLTLSDCLEIIHGLNTSDYFACTKSINPDHLNNTLIIFEPELIKLKDGRTFSNLIIYLKIDLDETTEDAVALVSIHKGSRGALPYATKI